MTGTKWISLVMTFMVILFLSTILLIVIVTKKFDLPFRFSNSISYDVKLNFLNKHKNLLKNSKTIVIGSSMALNNIDSKYLEKTEKFEKTVNLSSWGLQVSEVFQLLKIIDLTDKKYVVILKNANFFFLASI